MSLERFELSEFLPYRLAVLSERVSGRLSREYSQSHGLTTADWRVLVHLANSDEVSVRDIRESVNLEKPRVSRAVSKLESAGFVRKKSDAHDQRLVAISLTEEGRHVLGEIVPIALTFESSLLNSLGHDEQAAFFNVVEKLHAVLDNDPKAPPRVKTDSRAGRR